MTDADRAWIALGVGVLAYDVVARPGMTLSEGADVYMTRHPWITRGVAFALASHVCNLVPAKWDVIHLVFKTVRREWR